MNERRINLIRERENFVLKKGKKNVTIFLISLIYQSHRTCTCIDAVSYFIYNNPCSETYGCPLIPEATCFEICIKHRDK